MLQQGLTCADALDADLITIHCFCWLYAQREEAHLQPTCTHSIQTHTQHICTHSNQILQGNKCLMKQSVTWRGTTPEVGSSNSNTEGLMIISCPTDTRLRSPPLIPRLKNPPAHQHSQCSGFETQGQAVHIALHNADRTTQQMCHKCTTVQGCSCIGRNRSPDFVVSESGCSLIKA